MTNPISRYRSLKSWGWMLGALLFWTVPACVTPISSSLAPEASVYRPAPLQKAETKTVLKALSQANVVYLGETHNQAADHQAQLEIIQALQRSRPQLAIAMEMFQRPYQPALDRYLAGDLTEAALQTQTQYAQRWGYPWEFYAPILQFAKDHQLSVVALNTPTEVTRKVARRGLDSLTPQEQRYIPPKADIILGSAAYEQRLRHIYINSHHGTSHSTGFDRFFLAQVLWDETMAEQIAKTLQQQPNTLVIVLAGQGHVMYGHGIPSRVARRLNPTVFKQPLVQRLVLLNPSNEVRSITDPAIADYFWFNKP